MDKRLEEEKEWRNKFFWLWAGIGASGLASFGAYMIIHIIKGN